MVGFMKSTSGELVRDLKVITCSMSDFYFFIRYFNLDTIFTA